MRDPEVLRDLLLRRLTTPRHRDHVTAKLLRKSSRHDNILPPGPSQVPEVSCHQSLHKPVFNEDESLDTDFLFNVETITAYENLDEIIAVSSAADGVQGIVFGRVDFCGSLGLTRSDINTPRITEYVLNAAAKAKAAGLDFVMGGAVSSDTLDVVREVAGVHLTRFETRKVVFAGEAAGIGNVHEGLVRAVHFELLWLTNKRDYYGRITSEDAKRIEMLESRWHLLNGD